MRPPVPELLLVTDPALADPLDATRKALEGCALSDPAAPRRIGVQLRAKSWPDRELLQVARALHEVTRERGALLLINGRVDVACAVKADGVHLPERGLSPDQARAVLAPGALIGVSRHDRAGIERATPEGADYATLGPFAPTPGKGPPLPRDEIAAIAASAPIPILALGGVGPDEVAPAVAAGAHGVAVIRAVYGQTDPAAAVRALLAALDRARAAGG